MSRPLIIPIFLSQKGCPHKCLFCNQERSTGIRSDEIRPGEIKTLIKSHIETAKGKFGAFSQRQIAFYGGNFTGLGRPTQEELLKICRVFIDSGEIESIRISTRPDALDEEACSFLKGHGVSTVEVGAQSMIDDVLYRSERGHTSRDVAQAVNCLREKDIEIGLHLMVGLPGDDKTGWEFSAQKIASLKPDFVRIHPTVVLKETALATLWYQGRYLPLGLNEAVHAVMKIYLRFLKKGVRVIRMGIQPTPELEKKGNVLAGPYHPAFGQLVGSALFFEMVTVLLQRLNTTDKEVTLRVFETDESNLRGQGNQNIISLNALYPGKKFSTLMDQNTEKGSLAMESGDRVQTISLTDLDL
jgi:histone acetyltransferase (RNA polymerase elongator complex component)